MKQKGFAQILIIILLVALVGGILYFGLPRNKVITPSPTPSAAFNVTSWKTYNSDPFFGFSVQYPQTYTLNDESARTVAVFFYPPGYSSLSEIQKQISPSISIEETASSSTPQAWVNTLKAPGYSNVRNITSLTVGGVKALQYTFNNIQAGNGQDEIETVIPFKNNSLFLINLNAVDKDSQSIYTQILSTFKFIDQTTWIKKQSSAWNIEYPEGWLIGTENNGSLSLKGSYLGTDYSIGLAYPNFTGTPEISSLDGWVTRELSFLNPEQKKLVKIKDITVAGASAKEVLNMPAIVFDDAKTIKYSDELVAKVYIWSVGNTNPRTILLEQTSGAFDSGKAEVFLDTFLSKIK